MNQSLALLHYVCNEDRRPKNTYIKHYSFSDFFRLLLSFFSVFSTFFFSFFGVASTGSTSCVSWNSSGLLFLGGAFIGDFSVFSGVGAVTSFLEDRSCLGEGSSSSEVVADFDLSFVSAFWLFRVGFVGFFSSSSPGMPSISAHWSGGGVGCFLSSSVSCFCGTNGEIEVGV